MHIILILTSMKESKDLLIFLEMGEGSSGVSRVGGVLSLSEHNLENLLEAHERVFEVIDSITANEAVQDAE
jgi:hypothetical protein